MRVLLQRRCGVSEALLGGKHEAGRTQHGEDCATQRLTERVVCSFATAIPD